MYWNYLIHFAVMLIVGTLFCLGLFMSSRGETEVAPDGSKVDLWAMILYPVTKLLCKSEKYKIYYTDDLLIRLAEKVKKIEPELYHDSNAHVLNENKSIGIVSAWIDRWVMIIPELEEELGCKILVEEDGFIRFYKEYEKFIFPSILFKPIIGCYKCYASVWGTVIFVLGTLFAERTNFLELDYTILIPMWVIYCFSLVTVNCIIYKIVKD